MLIKVLVGYERYSFLSRSNTDAECAAVSFFNSLSEEDRVSWIERLAKTHSGSNPAWSQAKIPLQLCLWDGISPSLLKRYWDCPLIYRSSELFDLDWERAVQRYTAAELEELWLISDARAKGRGWGDESALDPVLYGAFSSQSGGPLLTSQQGMGFRTH